MKRIMLHSKIHQARVSEVNLHYEGSITIDEDLMDAADILPDEQLWVLNVNNGERFHTYAIKGRRGSGEICLNGPAARLAQKGDYVHILSYIVLEDSEARGHRPKIVILDENNKIKSP